MTSQSINDAQRKAVRKLAESTHSCYAKPGYRTYDEELIVQGSMLYLAPDGTLKQHIVFANVATLAQGGTKATGHSLAIYKFAESEWDKIIQGGGLELDRQLSPNISEKLNTKSA